MIKKIHYCWFGSPLPESVRSNIDKWAALNPDFEIIEWNDSNIDVSNYEFGRRAVEQKKLGYIGDVVRLQALIEYGGFYIDCDVELFKSLRTLQTDDKHLVMGYMYKCALGTAMFYSPPQHPILKEILNLYNEVKHESWPVSNSIYTDYFINNVPNFLLNGKAWENENITLYPKEFFEQPAFIPSQGYSIHHCCGSWDPNSKNKTFALSLDSNHWIKWLKRKINTARALRKNEYYEYYKQACKGISVKKPSTWRQSK